MTNDKNKSQSFDIQNQNINFTLQNKSLNSEVMKRLLLLFAISLMAMSSAFAETATFDFSSDEAQAAYTINNTSGTACTLSAQQDVVKLYAIDNGDGVSYGLAFKESQFLRIYGEYSLFKISVPTGYKITKISFELNDHYSFMQDNNFQGPELIYSGDENTETYTAPSTEIVTEVAYKAISSDDCPHIERVIVEYETSAPDFTWNFSDATFNGGVVTDGNGILVKNCSDFYSDGDEMWMDTGSHLNIELENGKKMSRIIVTSHKSETYDPIQWIVDQTVDATWTNLGSYVGEWTGESESVACGGYYSYIIDKIEAWVAKESAEASVEPALAALLGSTTYINSYYESIRVNADGQIESKWNNGNNVLFADFYTLSKNADGRYVAKTDEKPFEYIFYVEDDAVTKIEEYEADELADTYVPAEPVLATFMGTAPYYSENGNCIYVNESGLVEVLYNDNIDRLTRYYALSVDAEGNFIATGRDSSNPYSFIFYIEEGNVTNIEMYRNSTLEETFAAPEPVIAALMGETQYKATNNAVIQVNEDGKIVMVWSGSSTTAFTEIFYFYQNADGNYVAKTYAIPFEYIFYVEDDAVTKIEEYQNGVLAYTYVPTVEEETPTDITDVKVSEVKENKVIKIIKNGKIVIIKNGVTYDLSGSVISE